MTKLLVFLLLLESCFGLWTQERSYIYIYSIILAISTVLYYRKTKKQKKSIESKIVLFFVLSLIVNIIACYINRGQTILQSLRESELLYYGYFMFFFVLCLSKISVKSCEKIIRICFFIACIVYLSEYFIFFPKPIINMLYFEEGEHRMRIVGQMVIFIGYFYYLNRFLTSKNKFNVENIAGLFLGFIVILTLGFRSSLIASVLVSFLLVMRQRGKNVISVVPYIIALAVVFLIVFNTDYGQETLLNMITRQQEGQTFDNEDYARVLEWNYFVNNHFVSVGDYIFGSGIPNYDSSYGQQIYNLFDFNKFGEPTSSIAQWRDWGIVGFSWILGIPAALVLVFFDLYMIFKKTPKEYYYISATYLFLLLIFVTTMEFYRQGSFAFHGLMLYILSKVAISKENAAKNKL